MGLGAIASTLSDVVDRMGSGMRKARWAGESVLALGLASVEIEIAVTVSHLIKREGFVVQCKVHAHCKIDDVVLPAIPRVAGLGGLRRVGGHYCLEGRRKIGHGITSQS
jgi:hypothetical protein